MILYIAHDVVCCVYEKCVWTGYPFQSSINNYPISSLHADNYENTQLNNSISDTLAPERTALIIEMSSFQGLKMYYVWQSIVNYLVPVTCIQYVST